MAQFVFETEGLDELSGRLKSLPEIIKSVQNDGFRAIGKLFVAAKGSGALADATPRRTGKLAKSSYFMIDRTSQGEQRLTIFQPAKSEGGAYYGMFVREGTGIYGPTGQRITPKTKKALAWGRDLGDGKKEFVRKSVKGQKPNPYHETLFTRLRPQIQEIVKNMGVRVIGHLSGKGGI